MVRRSSLKNYVDHAEPSATVSLGREHQPTEDKLGQATRSLKASRLRFVLHLFKIALGFCFFYGGASVVFLWALLLRFVPSERERYEFRVRWLISYLLGKFCTFVQMLGLIRIHVSGELGSPGESKILMANHPSLIDALVLMSIFPASSCVVKKALGRHFLLGFVIRSAGYVIGDRPVAIIKESIRQLRVGRTLVWFPEGTRSPENGLWPFHEGAVYVTGQAPAALLPVVLRYNSAVLPKGAPWYHVALDRVELEVQICNAQRRCGLGLVGDAPSESRALAQEKTAELERFFQDQLYSAQ